MISVLQNIVDKILAFLHPAMTEAEVAERLDERAEAAGERLDWRQSIVDLLKLLKLDASFNARKTLSEELGYSGPLDDSGEMNEWLRQEVMREVAEHGIKIPAGEE
jgi:hypothetical protein